MSDSVQSDSGIDYESPEQSLIAHEAAVVAVMTITNCDRQEAERQLSPSPSFASILAKRP